MVFAYLIVFYSEEAVDFVVNWDTRRSSDVVDWHVRWGWSYTCSIFESVCQLVLRFYPYGLCWECICSLRFTDFSLGYMHLINLIFCWSYCCIGRCPRNGTLGYASGLFRCKNSSRGLLVCLKTKAVQCISNWTTFSFCLAGIKHLVLSLFNAGLYLYMYTWWCCD